MSLLSHIQDNTPIVTHPIYRLNDVIAYVGNHGYIANETNIHTITPYPCVHVQMYMYMHVHVYTLTLYRYFQLIIILLDIIV